MAAQVNPDLQRERDRATFSPLELTYIIDGGRDQTERRKYIENLADNDEEFKHKSIAFMSRSEQYSLSVKKAVALVKRIKELDLTDNRDVYWFRQVCQPHESIATALHQVMFLPMLRSQSNDEQLEQFMPKASEFQMFGTYAQTEMGHGTFIRGLETTAHYDQAKEEFVLNSPTVTSTKWWPGTLGKTTNHAIVMAQLYTQGKCYGVHPFMVQTRSLEDHQPLRGITIGDIGPKFGYGTNDNGFLKMDHVRIPRNNMLAKHSEVLKDGTYVRKTTNSKMTYGTMVFVRAMIVYDVARGLAQASTIATRYSAIRHQSEMKPGGPEPQILEYQTQQYKLFPLLASAYALMFSGQWMRDTYFTISSELEAGNLEKLPELHALSSGLKAFSSSEASLGIEVCRLACGGHGYSEASGIPKIYRDVTPACTYEGENTVMYLQTARYLMKCVTKAQTGQSLPSSVAYLTQKNFPKFSINNGINPTSLVTAYQYRAFKLVEKAAQKLAKLKSSGKPQEIAWNETSVELVQAAKAHCHFFVVKTFVEMLSTPMPKAVRDVLSQVCLLYALHGITQNSGEFMHDGYMNHAQCDRVQERVLDLMAVIRPNAVALVDAFDFHDRVLDSVLGRYDGNVYENLFKWAQASDLNQSQVHESYYQYLRPLIKNGASSLVQSKL